MSKCYYCKTWQGIPSKYRRMEGTVGSKISFRQCPIIHKEVEGSHESCDKIEPGKFFWCDQNNEKIDFVVCVARIRNGVCRCTQGMEIINLFSW
jgi:hypothetical protein